MSVAASDRELVKRLVTQYCQRMLVSLSNAPPEVAATLAERFDVLPAEVTEDDVAALERQLPAPLPPLFVAYLTCGAFRRVEWDEFVLPPVPPGRRLTVVSSYMLDDAAVSLWPCGYMQFASGPCGDPVCFDIQRPEVHGEYPIIVLNHDIIPREAWSRRESLCRYSEQIAGSFVEFLEFLCAGGSSR